MVCGSVSHTSDRWKARQSNMTSVSSAVTMTAFEPVIVACNAYKSKQVSASSCVDCSSATSTHPSAVILEQVSSQVTYNALSCSISLYHCIVHSPTKARLVEGTAQDFSALLYVVSSYQAFVLNGCVCTSVYSFRMFDGRW